MKNAVVWIIKFTLAAALFFPLAYGTGVCLFLSSGYSFAWLPILAAALGIYAAAAVVIFKFGRKKQAAEGTPVKTQKELKPAIIFFSSLAAVLALILARGTIKDKLIRMNAARAYKAADEIVCYQNDRNTKVDILTTPLSKDSLLIDYDRMRASFIYRVDYDRMKQVRLKNREDKEIAAPVQFRYGLSDPGSELTVYGSGRETSGISVEMQSGSFWYTDLDSSYLGFDENVYGDIKQAEHNADESVVYSSVNSVSITGYSDSITENTVSIDYDEMKVYLVYFSEGVTHCETIPLDKNGVYSEGTVTAEVPFSNGTLRAYTAAPDHDRDSGRCDGLVFIDKEGTEWFSPEGIWGYYDLSVGRYAK